MINLVTFPRLFFPDKVHENLETVRSYSDKLGFENKQKSAFLLISANKDWLCLGIQTYFSLKSNYIKILVMSIMKTVSCVCCMSILKVMTGSAILLSHI